MSFTIIINFTEDCFRCDIDIRCFCETASPKLTKRERVSEMIAVFKSEEKYKELCRICSVNSLLLHRCEEFYLLLNEKEKLFHKIDNHLKNIKYQLSRLYRIRNEIAHSASIEMYQCNMIRFIEHLDDYLMSFVAEVLNCVFEHKDRMVDLDEVLEIIKNNYKDFQDIKKSKDATLLDRILSDLFEVGEINLIR